MRELQVQNSDKITHALYFPPYSRQILHSYVAFCLACLADGDEEPNTTWQCQETHLHRTSMSCRAGRAGAGGRAVGQAFGRRVIHHRTFTTSACQWDARTDDDCCRRRVEPPAPPPRRLLQSRGVQFVARSYYIHWYGRVDLLIFCSVTSKGFPSFLPSSPPFFLGWLLSASL